MIVMDKRYALIGPDNKAINFITWDGVTEFDYGQNEGNYLVPLDDVERYGFGWTWNGSSFDEPVISLPVPESITRRQCAKQLLALGMISSDEAIAMTRNGTPPAMVQAYLDNMQEPDRTSATIDFAADTYLRSNPLLLALMSANGMTEQQVDEYFIAASQL